MREVYEFAGGQSGFNAPVSAFIDENKLLEQSRNQSRISARAKHFVRNLSIPGAVMQVMSAFCGVLTPLGGTADAKRAFNRWASSAEMTQGKSLAEVNSELTGVLTWGDCLIALGEYPYSRPGEVCARVKIIDASCVDTPPKYRDGGFKNGLRAVLGVALDRNDIEVGYFVRKAGAGGSSDSDYSFLPRYSESGRFVSRLVRRPNSAFPGQLRGFPMFACCMNEISDLEQLCKSAVRSGISKSLLSVLLRTADPESARKGINSIDPKTGKPMMGRVDNSISGVAAVVPGGAAIVPDGLEPYVISHGGNVDLVALIKMELQMISAAVHIPYEILMSSFLGINFSGGKLSYDSFFRMVDSWNYGPIQSVWAELYRAVVMESFLLSGRIPSEDDLRCEWKGSVMPDPDPQKSANAAILRINAGLMSRSEEVARQGHDYETLLNQEASDNRMEREILGCELGVAAAEAAKETEEKEKEEGAEQ